MVLIGGITRLTGSGLSITEWKPIMGAVPPMSAADWEEAFSKYKTIPEYELKNQGMDLAGFKRIFFWEYLHRNWGRLMGVVFIVPFVLFVRKGMLKGWLLRRSIAILIGGGVAGSLGWFMVMSGLDGPDVSQYRLAIHLCAALAVFAMVQWTAMDLRSGRRSFTGSEDHAGRWARVLLLLLTVQVVWGAFTAGLDAGTIYKTWPLMNGEFMPENVRAFGDPWTDFTAHRDGAQFVHRNLAWVVAAAFVVHAIRFRKVPGQRWIGLLAGVGVQFVLGVVTVLTQVGIVWGVMHQLGALVLLAVLLKAMHATGRGIAVPA